MRNAFKVITENTCVLLAAVLWLLPIAIFFGDIGTLPNKPCDELYTATEMLTAAVLLSTIMLAAFSAGVEYTINIIKSGNYHLNTTTGRIRRKHKEDEDTK